MPISREVRITETKKLVESNHVIEIEKDTLAGVIEHPQLPVAVASSIKKRINELPPLSANCCIYRVPPNVRNLNERVYAPQVVSIGPFHHGESKLQAMEEHKLRYLRAFLQRSPGNCSLLEHCENKIRGWEKDIRNSYANTFDLTSDQFVRIVLVDSCFVIEAILSYIYSKHHRTFYLPKSNFLYETDMMLLENQLPFFVLDGLYHLTFPREPKTKFFEYCITYFFHRMLIQVDENKLITKVKDYVVESHQILHFVDLLRVCHLPTALRLLSDETFDLVTIPKVTGIHEAGIKLKKGSSIFPLDIQYSRAVLEIPQVVVDEASEYLLSNILVLEMCHYKDDSYVRDYVFFMDMLIDTPKDVDLLIQSGIIVSWTRDSSAVANLFNNVGYNFPLVGSRYYFYSVCRELEAYCSITRHQWKAAFKRDYCSTPWMIASTTTAIILLVLTFIQAICSIIQTKPSITSF